MPIGIKFSQFIAGGNLKVTDKTVGVRDGLNTIFTDPSDGILDENSNYLLRYLSGSSSAVNAVLFKNAASGAPAEITVGGSDSNASLKIYPKANGSLILETPSEGDIILRNIGNGSTNLISSGLGNINFTTNMGKVIINETTGIDAVLDEDNMASNSATAVPTQQSVKAYVDGRPDLSDLTYITSTDETADLPNSFQLLGTANQITVNNGVLSLPSAIIAPGTLQATTSLNIAMTTTVDGISNSATASSATELMTANAVQLAIANQVSSAKSFRGGYNASSNLFPSTGGSGTLGAILAGDVWVVTTPGTLGGTAVSNGDTVLALVDTPGQTAGNWAINANGVASVFGRAGVVTAQSGDYSFSLISGTAAINQGGTNATTIGASGTLAQSNGTAYTFTTATYPATATGTGKLLRADGTNWVASTPTFPNTATSGKLMRGDGTNWTETTAQYPNTVGTAGNVLTSDGTNWISSAPIIPSSYGTLRWANAETGGAFAFTTTPTEMNNIASISYAISGTASDFSLSGTGRLQYTGATTKKFVVRGGLSWAELAYGVNIQLYQNGSPIGNSTYTAGGNNNTPSYVITLAQNQYISLYGWRVAVSLTIISAWISVTEFST